TWQTLRHTSYLGIQRCTEWVILGSVVNALAREIIFFTGFPKELAIL
ncbi:MAG: hypothetical protein QOD90_510, partial [Mycobacterium sp.]|nr:hypothetical protein [Mycobacterium sp.]